MILIDTNVISEPLRQRPDPRVVEWLDAQAVETLFLPSVGVAEVRFGISALPPGKRREVLQHRFESEVLPHFRGRILAFDEAATVPYAAIRAKARAEGSAIGDFDALIASIAHLHDFSVATRDVGPFETAGVIVINPFAVR